MATNWVAHSPLGISEADIQPPSGLDGTGGKLLSLHSSAVRNRFSIASTLTPCSRTKRRIWKWTRSSSSDSRGGTWSDARSRSSTASMQSASISVAERDAFAARIRSSPDADRVRGLRGLLGWEARAEADRAERLARSLKSMSAAAKSPVACRKRIVLNVKEMVTISSSNTHTKGTIAESANISRFLKDAPSCAPSDCAC
mmetsp:Transcript_45929/g.103477  ORF Transcript_45929/g.103477 Transcript_45929/m.103477 type:complete len:200 (+) Transcript_45929:1200-1799(+)